MKLSYAEIESAARALETEDKLHLISDLGLSLTPTEIERAWYKEALCRHDALAENKSTVRTLESALDKIHTLLDRVLFPFEHKPLE